MKALGYLAALVLSTAMACGQGLVAFANDNASLITTNGGGAVPVGTRFSVNLYYNASSDPANLPSSFTIALGNPVNIGPTPGRFNGGIRTTPPTTQPGQSAWFQVKMWETAFGATYEEAFMNLSELRTVDGVTRFQYLGVSNPFFLMTGIGTIGGTPITSNPNFTGVTILLIPEPSVIALGLLGMAGAWLARRRKRTPHESIS